MDTLIGFCSFPDGPTATHAARALVAEKLAGCVTQIPGARSIYRWQGEVTESEEIVAIIKTTADRVEALMRRLPSLHPYEVPELVFVRVTDGLPSYLGWLRDALRE